MIPYSAPGIVGHHRQELLPCHGIVAERAKHPAGHHVGTVFVHTSGGHTVMFGLDHNPDAIRLKDALNNIGNLRRHLFLDLEALGVGINNTGEL